jgi:hypothetical protein
MPDHVLGLAGRFWRSDFPTNEYHRVSHVGGLAAIWPDHLQHLRGTKR